MIITIDGPAAAGKGTLAAILAKTYNLAYFDTGMVYRAVGLEMLLANKNLSDSVAAEKEAQKLTFAKMNELSRHPDFRSATGGNAASVVSAYPGVRAALLKMQQDFSHSPVFADGTPAKGVIYDGRDTGTVVCPQAELKFFVTASPETRAERRYKEFLQKGQETTYEKVLEDVRSRDERDMNRATAPLKPAADAIILDTTDLSIEDVFSSACKTIDAVLEK